MITNELVCKPDGTQELVQKEVADDYFDVPTPEPTAEEKLRADVDFLAIMTGVEL
jgi:hypothetical protein